LRDYPRRKRWIRHILGKCPWLGLFLLPAILCPLFPGAAWSNPRYELKVATLAPDHSTFMQIFNEMNEELLRETEGRVGFRVYSGFAMGDEEDVLRKVRVGLVHGAVFTASALTDINVDFRVLQIPFLFNDYEEVDHVKSVLDERLRHGFAQAGFEVLGWPEVGFIYFMSTTPIAGLEDLRRKKVWAKANAPMSQALIDRAGVATVAINIPDVLVALQTGLLEVVYNSPYYALVTQWNTRVKYFTDLPLSYIDGAFLVDRRAFDRIPPELQEKARSICARHMARVNAKTRKDNEEALEIILRRGVEKVTPTRKQAEEFQRMSDQAMSDLRPEFLPPEMVDRAREALADLRSRRASP